MFSSIAKFKFTYGRNQNARTDPRSEQIQAVEETSQENSSSSIVSVYNSISTAMSNMTSYMTGWWEKGQSNAIQKPPCLVIVPYIDLQKPKGVTSPRVPNYRKLFLLHIKQVREQLSTPPSCDILYKYIRPEVLVEITCSGDMFNRVVSCVESLHLQAIVNISSAEFLSNFKLIEIAVENPHEIPTLPCSNKELSEVVLYHFVAQADQPNNYTRKFIIPAPHVNQDPQANAGSEIVLHEINSIEPCVDVPTKVETTTDSFIAWAPYMVYLRKVIDVWQSYLELQSMTHVTTPGHHCLAIVPYKPRARPMKSILLDFKKIFLFQVKLLKERLSTPQSFRVLYKYLRAEIIVEVIRQVKACIEDLQLRTQVRLPPTECFSDTKVIKVPISTPCKLLMSKDPNFKVIVTLDCVAEAIKDFYQYITRLEVDARGSRGREMVLYKGVIDHKIMEARVNKHLIFIQHMTDKIMSKSIKYEENKPTAALDVQKHNEITDTSLNIIVQANEGPVIIPEEAIGCNGDAREGKHHSEILSSTVEQQMVQMEAEKDPEHNVIFDTSFPVHEKYDRDAGCVMDEKYCLNDAQKSFEESITVQPLVVYEDSDHEKDIACIVDLWTDVPSQKTSPNSSDLSHDVQTREDSQSDEENDKSIECIARSAVSTYQLDTAKDHGDHSEDACFPSPANTPQNKSYEVITDAENTNGMGEAMLLFDVNSTRTPLNCETMDTETTYSPRKFVIDFKVEQPDAPMDMSCSICQLLSDTHSSGVNPECTSFQPVTFNTHQNDIGGHETSVFANNTSPLIPCQNSFGNSLLNQSVSENPFAPAQSSESPQNLFGKAQSTNFFQNSPISAQGIFGCKTESLPNPFLSSSHNTEDKLTQELFGESKMTNPFQTSVGAPQPNQFMTKTSSNDDIIGNPPVQVESEKAPNHFAVHQSEGSRSGFLNNATSTSNLNESRKMDPEGKDIDTTEQQITQSDDVHSDSVVTVAENNFTVDHTKEEKLKTEQTTQKEKISATSLDFVDPAVLPEETNNQLEKSNKPSLKRPSADIDYSKEKPQHDNNDGTKTRKVQIVDDDKTNSTPQDKVNQVKQTSLPSDLAVAIKITGSSEAPTVHDEPSELTTAKPCKKKAQKVGVVYIKAPQFSKAADKKSAGKQVGETNVKKTVITEGTPVSKYDKPPVPAKKRKATDDAFSPEEVAPCKKARFDSLDLSEGFQFNLTEDQKLPHSNKAMLSEFNFGPIAKPSSIEISDKTHSADQTQPKNQKKDNAAKQSMDLSSGFQFKLPEGQKLPDFASTKFSKFKPALEKPYVTGKSVFDDLPVRKTEGFPFLIPNGIFPVANEAASELFPVKDDIKSGSEKNNFSKEKAPEKESKKTENCISAADENEHLQLCCPSSDDSSKITTQKELPSVLEAECKPVTKTLSDEEKPVEVIFTKTDLTKLKFTVTNDNFEKASEISSGKTAIKPAQQKTHNRPSQEIVDAKIQDNKVKNELCHAKEPMKEPMRNSQSMKSRNPSMKSHCRSQGPYKAVFRNSHHKQAQSQYTKQNVKPYTQSKGDYYSGPYHYYKTDNTWLNKGKKSKNPVAGNVGKAKEEVDKMIETMIRKIRLQVDEQSKNALNEETKPATGADLAVEQTPRRTSEPGDDAEETNNRSTESDDDVDKTTDQTTGADLAVEQTPIRTSEAGVDVEETNNRTSESDVDVEATTNQTTGADITVEQTPIRTSETGVALEETTGQTTEACDVVEQKPESNDNDKNNPEVNQPARKSRRKTRRGKGARMRRRMRDRAERRAKREAENNLNESSCKKPRMDDKDCEDSDKKELEPVNDQVTKEASVLKLPASDGKNEDIVSLVSNPKSINLENNAPSEGQVASCASQTGTSSYDSQSEGANTLSSAEVTQGTGPGGLGNAGEQTAPRKRRAWSRKPDVQQTNTGSPRKIIRINRQMKK